MSCQSTLHACMHACMPSIQAHTPSFVFHSTVPNDQVEELFDGLSVFPKIIQAISNSHVLFEESPRHPQAPAYVQKAPTIHLAITYPSLKSLHRTIWLTRDASSHCRRARSTTSTVDSIKLSAHQPIGMHVERLQEALDQVLWSLVVFNSRCRKQCSKRRN